MTANIQVDMPRRIGKGKYDPAGLLLEFRGWPGRVRYDIPYATIAHANPEPSFIAAQRFASIDAEDAAFAVVALGGNQSFRVAPREGVVAASLGASIQGRADKRPKCKILPSGYADHLITSGGDLFLGAYEHRFALVLCHTADVAATADRLRIGETPCEIRCGGEAVTLPAFGIRELTAY